MPDLCRVHARIETEDHILRLGRRRFGQRGGPQARRAGGEQGLQPLTGHNAEHGELAVEFDEGLDGFGIVLGHNFPSPLRLVHQGFEIVGRAGQTARPHAHAGERLNQPVEIS